MYQNNYNLNFVPGGVPLTIHISQYDVGTRTFHFTPIAVPGTVTTFTGASATLEATKPDGYAVIQNCTYNSDGSIDYTVQEQLAAKAGKVWSKIVLRNGSDVIGTAAVVWIVDKAGVTDDAIVSDSDVSGIRALVDAEVASIVDTYVDEAVEPIEADVADLKSAISNIGGEIYSYTLRTETTSATGWRLNESDGLCSSDSDYTLVKYTVTAGDTVKVVSDDRFQFQTVASVPSSGTSNRVGVTYGAGTFILTVPETATYLIVSTPTTSSAAVYDVGSIVDNLQSALTFALPTASASGAVASFTDGAEDVPVKNLTVSIEPKQEGSGDPSPTNVRPIAGWTGSTVTRAGKNLITSPAETTVTSSSVLKDRIVLKPGTYSFSLSAKNTGSATGLIRLTKDNNIVADIQIPTGVSSYTRYASSFTLGETATLRISAQGVTAGYNYTVKDFQIEIGTTATPYEAYTASIYSISWESEAGTVYGGTLDVTTGVLTVTRGIQTITSFSGTVESNGIRSNKILVGYYGKAYGNIQCNMFNTATSYSEAVATDDIGRNSIGANSSGLLLFNVYKDGAYMKNLDDINALIPSEGCKVVYPLATPITYTLTPTEIRTLLGSNNIYADTGDMEVSYRADTTRYIDRRLNTQQKLISGVETSYTATKNYAIGDYVIVADTLYKVTAAIATGATITPGTNCVATTVAEQLILLANA